MWEQKRKFGTRPSKKLVLHRYLDFVCSGKPGRWQGSHQISVSITWDVSRFSNTSHVVYLGPIFATLVVQVRQVRNFLDLLRREPPPWEFRCHYEYAYSPCVYKNVLYRWLCTDNNTQHVQQALTTLRAMYLENCWKLVWNLKPVSNYFQSSCTIVGQSLDMSNDCPTIVFANSQMNMDWFQITTRCKQHWHRPNAISEHSI